MANTMGRLIHILFLKVMGKCIILMVHNFRACSRTDTNMDKVNYFILMEAAIKEIGRETLKKASEDTSIRMERYLKERILMEIVKEKVD